MWIKFSEALVNFELVNEMRILTQDEGCFVRLMLDCGGIMTEPYSTPRAAQDRFDALAGMLTGERIQDWRYLSGSCSVSESAVKLSKEAPVELIAEILEKKILDAETRMQKAALGVRK